MLVDGACWYCISIQENGTLEVESNFPADQFRALFRLETSGEETEAEILTKGPELKPYASELRGLRLLKPTDAEEVFFHFLCSANNHISRIGQMIRKLAAYGEAFDEVHGETVYKFPRADRIAQIPESELRAAGFGYRAASIPLAARALVGRGNDWLAGLSELPYRNLRAELVGIKSVGPKLADCVALFGLHRTDVVPIDTHIWQAMTRLYFPQWQGLPLTAKRYDEASDFFRARFGVHTGWAHQYLFYDSVLHWRERRQIQRP